MEDIAHDAFLRAFERLNDLTDRGAFRSWLGAIVVHAVRSRMRRQRLLSVLGMGKSAEPVDLDAIASSDASPHTRAQIAQIYALLRTLPTDDRIAWTLRAVEGHDLETVARLTRCSLATVKRRISRAQHFLDDHFIDATNEGSAPEPTASPDPRKHSHEPPLRSPHCARRSARPRRRGAHRSHLGAHRAGARGRSAASRRPVFAYLAIAAAFSAFAGGVFVGKVAFQGPVLTAIAPVQSNRAHQGRRPRGRQRRAQLPAPGGGQLLLQPGATVEVERAGGQLTLKLLQGAASVDTLGAPQTPGLMIVAGEAQLNTQAGSVVNVRRNQDDLDVSVSDGSVSITSPADPKPQKLGRGGQLEGVPLHTAVAALSPTSPPVVRGPLLTAGAHRPNQPRAGGKSAAVDAPGWLTSYENNEDSTALALLRQLPGGLPGAISNARSAQELMAISTIARGKDGDPGAAISALKERRRPLPGRRERADGGDVARAYVPGGGQERSRHGVPRARQQARRPARRGRALPPRQGRADRRS